MAAGSEESHVERELVKHLIASIPCAVCHNHYEPDDVHIVDRHGEIWIVAVECSHCGTQGLVFAMIKEGEEPEMVGELTPHERARLREMGRIDADDVLDVHEFLRDFDGDFVSLFE